MTKLSVIIELKTNKNLPKVVDQIATLFPEVTKQTTEFHVTVAVADDLPEEKVNEAVAKLKPIISQFRKKLTVGPIDSMENHNKEGVLFADVNCDGLEDLHWAIRELLESYGGKFTYPDFVAHMTLAYLPRLPDAEQKKLLATVELAESFEVNPQDIDISIKKNDEWVKIAKHLLSKRSSP